MSRGHLFIRADGSTRIGMGHLMRCSTLANGWVKAGGGATIATVDSRKFAELKSCVDAVNILEISAQHPDPSDLYLTNNLIQQLRPTWTVVDGYHFDSAYQTSVHAISKRLMLIDDCADLDGYRADLVLNQNIDSHQLTYPKNTVERFLLGPSYSLIDERYEPWRNKPRTAPQFVENILVTIGGGDPDNQTNKVIDALARIVTPPINVSVIVGPFNPHAQSLERVITQNSRFRSLKKVKNMAELMSYSDLAVSGGGSTCWELAFMGVPTCVIVTAENQRRIAMGLDREEFAKNLGQSEDVTVEAIAKSVTKLMSNQNLRQSMSDNGRRLVDGFGLQRVLSAMASSQGSVKTL